MTQPGPKRAAARRAFAIAGAAVLLPLLPAPYAAASRSSCVNGAYLVSGHTLAQLDERAGRAKVVGTFPVQVNAMDYAPSQGRFYGVASYPDGSHLVAIDAPGALVDLGPAPPGTGDAYAGAITDGRWYLRALGDLVVVDIDAHSPSYLDVIARRPLDHTVDLGDWAVNPTNGLLYGIDATGPDPGRLTTVNPATGHVTVAALTNVPGAQPYGAVVLDASGVLHALRNADGRMFHVPLADPGNATWTWLGLAARTTDAAGCPRAWDYGDAPDSYGTTLSTNGPQHTIDTFDQLSIGDAVDDEPDGQPSADASADSDSIEDPVTVAVGNVDVAVPVRNDAGHPALLAGWIDLDGDGTFEPSEGVRSRVPPGATTVGLHWSAGITTPDEFGFLRLRLYADESENPRPTGTASGGEVEDLQVRFHWPKTDPAPPVEPTAGLPPGTPAPPSPSIPPPTTPTLGYSAAQPARATPPSSTLPVPLTIFLGVLVPAIVVAARGVAHAARHSRR